MTPQNFNWFLHTMLFYHTKNIIKKQAKKSQTAELNDNNDSSEDE